jgi:hypothetical protein
LYTIGRLIEDTRKIASEATGQYFLDIAVHAAEETLADFYSHDWPFYSGESGVTTIEPYTTGTIAAVLNSQSIVGTGTTWNTAWPVPAVIRPAEGGEPFIVTSFDSTTGLTIDRPWPFASDASMTYSLEFPSYTIPEYITISAVSFAGQPWQPPMVISSLAQILYDRAHITPRVYPWAFYIIPGDGTTDARLVMDAAPSQVGTIRFLYTRAVPEFRCLIGSGNSAPEGGLATIAAAGTALTGSNTSWLKLGYSLVGHYFEAADQTDIYSAVSAVATDTGATVAAWGGRALSGASYYISPQILVPDDFRPMLRDLMRWKYFQNANEIELAQAAEARYRKNYALAIRRVNRVRQGRTLAPVCLGDWGEGVQPPAMPWKLVMEYSP